MSVESRLLTTLLFNVVLVISCVTVSYYVLRSRNISRTSLSMIRTGLPLYAHGPPFTVCWLYDSSDPTSNQCSVIEMFKTRPTGTT